MSTPFGSGYWNTGYWADRYWALGYWREGAVILVSIGWQPTMRRWGGIPLMAGRAAFVGRPAYDTIFAARPSGAVVRELGGLERGVGRVLRT